MSMSLEAAAQVMREALRETVRRHSLWYLVQGGLMALGGILALVYPVLSSAAVLILLGWILIITGISLPITAVWLLGVLLGIQLISEGAALAYLAWHVRQS
jgi:uncharacterized membrane protein HdeD (DUF308 family)